MGALRKILAEATPGPWTADGPPWNRIVWSSSSNRVCFMAHSNGLDDVRDIATSNLIALAPSLAAALLKAEEALRECDKLRAVMCEASPGSGDTLAAWLEGFDAASGMFRAAISEIPSITGGGNV